MSDLLTLRIESVEPWAFDTLYFSEDGGSGEEYPYGVIQFSDRDGRKYWWATAADTKSLEILKAGQFIKTTYEVRDELPGVEQVWHEPEPSGLSIYDLHWRYAPLVERWGVTQRQRKSRCTGNLAPKNQGI